MLANGSFTAFNWSEILRHRHRYEILITLKVDVRENRVPVALEFFTGATHHVSPSVTF